MFRVKIAEKLERDFTLYNTTTQTRCRSTRSVGNIAVVGYSAADVPMLLILRQNIL